MAGNHLKRGVCLPLIWWFQLNWLELLIKLIIHFSQLLGKYEHVCLSCAELGWATCLGSLKFQSVGSGGWWGRSEVGTRCSDQRTESVVWPLWRRPLTACHHIESLHTCHWQQFIYFVCLWPICKVNVTDT